MGFVDEIPSSDEMCMSDGIYVNEMNA